MIFHSPVILEYLRTSSLAEISCLPQSASQATPPPLLYLALQIVATDCLFSGCRHNLTRRRKDMHLRTTECTPKPACRCRYTPGFRAPRTHNMHLEAGLKVQVYSGIPCTPNPQIAPRSRPVGASFLLQQTDDHALPPFFCNEKRPNCISEEMRLAFTRASQVHNLMQLMVSCICFFTGLNPASDFVVVV